MSTRGGGGRGARARPRVVASTSDVVIVITVTAAEGTVRRRPGDGAWRERQDRRARAAGLGAAPSSQKEDPVPTRWPLARWARRPGEGRCPSHACRRCGRPRRAVGCHLLCGRPWLPDLSVPRCPCLPGGGPSAGLLGREFVGVMTLGGPGGSSARGPCPLPAERTSRVRGGRALSLSACGWGRPIGVAFNLP